MISKATNVDMYIAGFPEATQMLLDQVRAVIKKAAPGAEETISYMMPAYKLHGMLVYFAGYKGHIGFYPGSGAIEAFKSELKGYKLSKGTLQLPLDKPLPKTLISNIVKYRVKENLEKQQQKKKK